MIFYIYAAICTSQNNKLNGHGGIIAWFFYMAETGSKHFKLLFEHVKFLFLTIKPVQT